MSIERVNSTEDDDRLLVTGAQAGDLSAFEGLVRRHQEALYCYLYRMCRRNSAEAEELAQETFVRAWQGLGGFRAEARFKTWLFRIGANLCINRLTRTRRLDPLTEEIPAPRQDEPEETHRRRVRSELVRAALDRLPADQRSALVLSMYEEMSYDEIAEAMGKSPASVNALLYRARMGVRRYLGRAHEQGLL